ncbi:thioredoxin domain-containing protein [bacterium]|nr:MAG: thioredoxin domain-containing protein [bacterium]
MHTSAKPNNLINEKSPYLQQHAYNPVNWFPWNETALELAKKENKPIFLSVGYSTCYWCHVMERECFENKEIADMLNKSFINIKVDREERPDIDRVYMSALQSLTGSGGWPMNMFLTPSLKPFYGATYIPPKSKYGRAGIEDIISQINQLWNKKRNEIMESSEKIFAILKNKNESTKEDIGDKNFDEELNHLAFEQAYGLYDFENGGFGQGNKFPRPVMLDYLLSYYTDYKDAKALDIVTYTLKKMCEGGIYDHLGGGFHRYAVDNIWRVPHFEKMLYDQAQIINTLLDTYLITKNDFFLKYAEETIKYVSERLLSPEGGFYSAEDAESISDNDVKEEGYYYLWTFNEIKNALGVDYDIFINTFGVLKDGNTIHDPHGVFLNRNVLYIANDVYDTAKTSGAKPEDIIDMLSKFKSELLKIRDKRKRPHLDDKILTSWNALMISALAKAYTVTGKDKYKVYAENCLKFIGDKLTVNNKLKHRYRDGEASFEATLEDYAYYINCLIDSYEMNFNSEYLLLADKLCGEVINIFYDNDSGGFYDANPERSDIILKIKDSYDGAEPSANSVMIENLLRLGYISGNEKFVATAEKSLKFFYKDISKSLFSGPNFLRISGYFLNSPKEIIFSGKSDSHQFKELLGLLRNKFINRKILIKADKKMSEYSVILNSVVTDFDSSKVYVCENFKCNLPVDNPEELKIILKNI